MAVRVLAAAAAVVVVLHWIGAFLPGPNAWGFHHWAFLPRPLLAIVGGLAALLLFPPVAGGVARVMAPVARALEAGRRPVVLLAVVLAVALAAFWLGRQRLFLLSDGELLIRLVGRGLPNLAFTADTLGALTQLWANLLTVDVLGIASETASFRLVAMTCGVIWMLAMFRTTARLVPDGWSRLAMGGLLATAGITKFFYGYVETGPLLAAAVALFILAGIRLTQGGGGVIPTTAAFLLAAAIHVTGLLLAPAWAWLLWRWAGADRRRRGMALGLLLTPVVLFGIFWMVLGGGSLQTVRDLYGPYFGKFLAPFGATDGKRAYTLLTIPRWTEFLNEQLYLGPFALLAWLPLWLAVPRHQRPAGPEVRFCLWILVPFLLLSIGFNRELGGARDWDLVATVAVPAILLVGMTLSRVPAAESGSRKARRAAPAGHLPAGPVPALVVSLLAASLFHLVGIVLVDAERERSRRHFLTLFADGAPVSRFARSYALEEVGLDDIEQGRADDAIRHLEEAARVDPSNVKALGTLGSLLNSRGDAARAMTLLEEAVRLRPDVALIHYNLGATQMSAGRSSDAALSFEQAIRLNPDIEPAWLGLANMALALEHPVAADSVARVGLERFPTNADLMVARAIAREKLGRTAEAVVMLEAASRAAPDNRTVLFNLGRLHNAAGRYEAAIPPLERLTGLDPADAEAWNNLGVARLELGRLDDAGQAFVNAINASVDLVPAYMNLAQALSRQGRNEEAMGTLQNFIDRQPALARQAGMDRMLDALRRAAHEPPAN